MRSRAYHRWGAGGCTACGAKERVGIGPRPNNPRLNATDPRDARIAELEAEVARLRESEPLTYRGQRDAALAEVARLEALIVEADTIHAPMSVAYEAARIRSRKP